MPAACRGRRRSGTRPPATATSSGSRIRRRGTRATWPHGGRWGSRSSTPMRRSAPVEGCTWRRSPRRSRARSASTGSACSRAGRWSRGRRRGRWTTCGGPRACGCTGRPRSRCTWASATTGGSGSSSEARALTSPRRRGGAPDRRSRVRRLVCLGLDKLGQVLLVDLHVVLLLQMAAEDAHELLVVGGLQRLAALVALDHPHLIPLPARELALDRVDLPQPPHVPLLAGELGERV